MIAAVSAEAIEVDFDSQIKPIFAAHCLSCHDEENEEGGFRIDRETTLDYVIAGDAEESDFFKYLVSEDEDELMPPPDEENPLSEEQITLVRTWINEGAQWPEGVTIEDAALQLTEPTDAGADEIDADNLLAADAGDDDADEEYPVSESEEPTS